MKPIQELYYETGKLVNHKHHQELFEAVNKAQQYDEITNAIFYITLLFFLFNISFIFFIGLIIYVCASIYTSKLINDAFDKLEIIKNIKE